MNDHHSNYTKKFLEKKKLTYSEVYAWVISMFNNQFMFSFATIFNVRFMAESFFN